ncbi:MAG: right-handed parallel beta-helix repeat-containing protein, partial [Elusimicrobiota bacterium]
MNGARTRAWARLGRLLAIAALILPLLSAEVRAAARKFAPRLRELRSGSGTERSKGRLRPPGQAGKRVQAVKVFLRLRPGVKRRDLAARYPGARFGAMNGRIVTAEMPFSHLDALEADPDLEYAEAAVRYGPALDVVRSTTVTSGLYRGVVDSSYPSFGSRDGAGVVIGLVDTGIDYTHEDFINAGGQTRILYIWDQTISSHTGGPFPSGYGYGAEYTQAQIDDEIDGSPAGVVLQTDTSGHGTHLAGIAAGDGSDTDGDLPAGTFTGMAPAADIIMVKTDYDDTDLIDGVNYIIGKAAALGKPAVINLAVTAQVGAHDGTRSFEQQLNTIAASTPVVVAMGNDHDNGIHASTTVAASGTDAFWIDIHTAYNWIDVEFWADTGDAYTASVSTDEFSSVDDTVTASSGTDVIDSLIDSTAISIWNGTNSHPSGDKQIKVKIYQNPSIDYQYWYVKFTRTVNGGSGKLHGWIFDVNYASFTTHVDTASTLGSPAVADNVVSVASFCSKRDWRTDAGGETTDTTICTAGLLGDIAGSSGRGPTRDGRTKPDFAAPGEWVSSSMSNDATVGAVYISRDGRHYHASGTSAAAPVLAGLIALRLQDDSTQTPQEVEDALAATARADSKVLAAGAVPNNTFGSGKVWVHGCGSLVEGSSAMSPTTLGISSISWTWSLITEADSYNVYYATDTGTPIANVSAPPFILEAVPPNTEQELLVKGQGTCGAGPAGASASTSTLANEVSGADFEGVSLTSVTVNWLPLPTAAQEGSTSTAEGYVLQASTSSDFTGTVYSSSTPNVELSTLTVSGLAMGATYYFRVGSLNWDDGANYVAAGSTWTYGWTSVWTSAGTEDTIGVAWGDYDNDGDLDLAVGNYTSTANEIYRNNGDGTFTSVWTSAETEYTTGVAWGDYDNDGDLDLAVANDGSGVGETNRVYRNDRGGTFTSAWNSSEAEATHMVAWGDFDNDGYLDLAAVNEGQANRVYRNNGDGAFASVWTSPASINTRSVAWGDYDNDGDLDMAVGNHGDVNRVFRNNGDWTFTTAWESGESEDTRSVAWGDFDNDGDLDLAAGNYNSQANRVYRNDGNDTFTSVWTSPEGENTNSVASGDFDGDGYPDIAVGNWSDVNRVYRNNGDATFASVRVSTEAESTWGVAWGDFDDDGNLDMGVVSTTTNHRVYRGVFPSSNTAPTAPGGLSASFEYDADFSTLTFKWDAADHDNNGSTESVYYALAVATGSINLSGDELRILSPSSFTLTWANGSPLLGHYPRPAYKTWPGDGGLKHGVFISTEPDAVGGAIQTSTTYYFRVRSIDAGLARGTWSAEASFYIQDPCDPVASVQTGSWSDSGTWSSGFRPTTCSPLTIETGHTVTVDITTATASTTTVLGTLKFSRVSHSSLTLVGGDITVEAGGHLDMGTEADPIPSGTTAHLVLASGTVAGQYGLIVQDGGGFTVRGATKSPYGYALASIDAGGTELDIAASSATAWAVGDTITIGPTNAFGPSEVEERVIDGIAGTDPLTISWSVGLSTARVLTDTSPIVVANLTRNVLVRSSGTDTSGNTAYIRNLARNATSFSLEHGEFAYLGANSTSKYGITFDGAGTRGSISSSTVRNGRYGVFLNGTSDNTLTANNLYSHSTSGIQLSGASGNTLTANNSYANGYTGILLDSSANNTLIENNAYAQGGYGILLQSSSPNNTLAENNTYSNMSGGIYLWVSSHENTLTENNSYSDRWYGIRINASSSNTLTANNIYSNGTIGLSFQDSTGNTLIANDIFSQGLYGVYIRNTFGTTLVGGNVGYDSDGNDLPNAEAEVRFYPGFSEDLTLKGARINPAVGISTTALDREGNYLISYNQDFDTGTVRIWGDYAISASTLTLDYSTQLYASTATTPKVMRGTGHSISIDSTNDANALSQLITFEYRDGEWHVDGSSSGVDMVTAFTGSPTDLAIPNSAPQVTVDFTDGGTPAEGDRVDFALIAAAGDQNVQKRLLFGRSADGFRDGRSKITADTDAGIVLKGVDGTHTLVDMLAGSTYYTFVDSGAFTAEYSSMTNMDPEGIQLSGSAGVSITTTTFDYMGLASGTNAYITARDLTSLATFYDVSFGLSRSSHGFDSAHNVRVEGGDSSLSWTFTRESGALWGEDHDDDPNGKVLWQVCDPVVSVQSGPWSDAATWTCGTIPTVSDEVVIADGHTVTVDITTATASTTTVSGTLKFSRVGQSSFTLVQGDLTVAAGGHLDMGTEADPIPTGTTAQLVLAYGQTAGQYGLIVQDGGDFTVRGATKSPYGFALAGIAASGTQLSIAASSATAWTAGDAITIGPTTGTGPGATEERVVTAITGGATLSVDWAVGITNGRALTSTTPIVVANLTRNVVVRSSGTDTSNNTAYIRNLARNATSFSLAYGEFADLGANAASKYGITFDGSDVRGTVSSCTVRGGSYGIYVDGSENITLAANNVYSSDNDGIHLQGVSNSTLSANSVYANSDDGIELNASSGNVVASNHSYSNNYEGLWVTGSSDNAFTDNDAHNNDDVGVYLKGSSGRNTLTGNNSHDNANDGFHVQSSSGNILSSNDAHSNGDDGINILASSGTTLGSNTCYSNGYEGVFLDSAAYNSLSGNTLYDNGEAGIRLDSSANNTLDANESYSNTFYGILLTAYSDDNTLVSNDAHDNSDTGIAVMDSHGASLVSNNAYSNFFEGIWLSGATFDSALAANRSYSNSRYGLYLDGSSTTTFAGGSLGYDQTGAAAANTTAEVFFNASKSEDLILKAARINPAVGISTAGFNREGNYLLSYNQDFDTGTVRVWGDYPLLGSTLTLDYSAQLHASTATTPKLMRGTGHSISIGSTHDAYALS